MDVLISIRLNQWMPILDVLGGPITLFQLAYEVYLQRFRLPQLQPHSSL